MTLKAVERCETSSAITNQDLLSAVVDLLTSLTYVIGPNAEASAPEQLCCFHDQNHRNHNCIRHSILKASKICKTMMVVLAIYYSNPTKTLPDPAGLATIRP